MIGLGNLSSLGGVNSLGVLKKTFLVMLVLFLGLFSLGLRLSCLLLFLILGLLLLGFWLLGVGCFGSSWLFSSIFIRSCVGLLFNLWGLIELFVLLGLLWLVNILACSWLLLIILRVLFFCLFVGWLSFLSLFGGLLSEVDGSILRWLLSLISISISFRCGIFLESFEMLLLSFLGRSLVVTVVRLFVIRILALLLLVFSRLGHVLDRCLKEFVENLVDLAVEDLSGDEWILVSSIVAVFLGWHDGDIINQDLKLIVVEILNKLVIEVLELLQAVIIIEELVDRAVFAVKQVFNAR